MESLEFSAPYNDDLGTLTEVFKLKGRGKNRIREIYLSGNQEYSGSGRIMPRIDINKFTDVVDKIHKEGIRVNLIFNSTCEGGNWYSSDVLKSTMEYLRQVHEEHGVEAITIANPLYIREVRKRFPDIEICASVLGDIDCVQRAIFYNKAGANVITLDVNINRDLQLLREIKEATGAELKLMVNEGCLYKCPQRKFHFNYISHKAKEMSTEGISIFFASCLQVSSNDLSQILKSCWIRPEDIRKYSKITKFFKIAGRSCPRSMVTRCTKAYLKESWDGDLLDILDSSLRAFGLKYSAYLNNKSLDKYKFFEKVTSCDGKCSQCGYCQELARTLIRFRKPTRGKLEDLGLKEVADELEASGTVL